MSDYMPDLRGTNHGSNVAVSTWYHGTPHNLNAGDIIEAGKNPANFTASSATEVSVTSEIEYAEHWAAEAGGSSVYEVELIAPTTAHRIGKKNYGADTAYYEVRTERVRVVRRATARK